LLLQRSCARAARERRCKRYTQTPMLLLLLLLLMLLQRATTLLRSARLPA
jgi:hypothetical protein